MAIKVGFVSLGCPKNQIDTEIMLKKLLDEGFEFVEEDIQADVVVINTCAFINEAKEEAGRIVKRAEKEAALEKSKAIDGMKQEIISVASLMASKIVEETMDESKQNELLETALKEMGEDTWQS